jgi:hypothetical protein
VLTVAEGWEEPAAVVEAAKLAVELEPGLAVAAPEASSVASSVEPVIVPIEARIDCQRTPKLSDPVTLDTERLRPVRPLAAPLAALIAVPV